MDGWPGRPGWREVLAITHIPFETRRGAGLWSTRLRRCPARFLLGWPGEGGWHQCLLTFLPLPLRPLFSARLVPRPTSAFFSVALLVAAPLAGQQPLEIQGKAGELMELPVAMATAVKTRIEARSPSRTGKGEMPGRYRITPERRALLNTIRYAEGTWIGGSREGYRVLYGGGRFQSLDRHPEIVVRKRYTSAAAGAYQFLPGTWGEAASKLRLSDFSPASQDQAALYLVEKRGALRSFEQQGLSAAVLARLSPEWASLPASHGGSYYGQPVKSRDELRQFFAAELVRQKGSRSDLLASRAGAQRGQRPG